MALPVQHKMARRGAVNEYIGYTYVGSDNFTDQPTVEDAYNLLAESLFAEQTGALIKPTIALIVSGDFYLQYPGHDPDEKVTTLSYGIDSLTAYESMRAIYNENPNASAGAWINDLIQYHTFQGQRHYWLEVNRISIID